jgi:hypothetical protein
VKLLLSITLIFIFFVSHAQESCDVKLKEIQGTYTGECEKGKAHGKGKSVGIDEYQGEFKNGYPDGWGMYVWKDGHYFIGSFKKGKKEGKGDMYYESSKGEDSVITGFWRKDVYAGLYEKPWELIQSTTKVGKVEARRIGDGSIVTITLQQMSNLGSSLPTITSEVILSGAYETKHYMGLSNQMNVRYQQVRFPFRAIFTFNGNETAEIAFYEPGDYTVTVSLTL